MESTFPIEKLNSFTLALLSGIEVIKKGVVVELNRDLRTLCTPAFRFYFFYVISQGC